MGADTESREGCMGDFRFLLIALPLEISVIAQTEKIQKKTRKRKNEKKRRAIDNLVGLIDNKTRLGLDDFISNE